MAMARQPGHDPGAWLRYAGRRASVLAPAGSFAARRAGEALSEADRTAAELDRLLGAPPGGPTPFDILLVDVVPAALGGDMPPDLTGLDLTPGAPPPLLRVVRPEGSAEPLAWLLTRLLVGERFGPRALAAETVLRGLAGLVAAGAESGPSRADADTWVQARLASRDRPMVLAAPSGAPEPAGARLAVRDGGSERLLELADGDLLIGRDPAAGLVLDGHGVSRRHAVLTCAGGRCAIRDEASRNGILVNGSPVPSAELRPGDRVRIGHYELVLVPPPPPPPRTGPLDPALTSFAGFLLDEFGAAAVRRYLEEFDPERQDRAAIAVFHAPLGALEEAWLRRQGQHAAGAGGVKAFASQVVPMLLPHRWRLVELTTLTLLASINTLALPLAFRYLVDDILPAGRVRDLVAFTLVLGVLLLLGNAIGLRGIYAASKLSERIGVELQERMFVHMQQMSHGFFTQIRGGDLLARFTRDLTIVQQALVTLASGALALVIGAIAAFVALAILNVYIAALVASVLPLYALAHMLLHARFRRLSYERQQQAGETVAVLQEAMVAHDLIKAYGGEERSLTAYRVRLLRMLDTAYRLVMTGAGLQASVGLMAALAQVEVLCLGGYLVFQGHLSLGTLLAAIGLAPSVLQPVSQLSHTAQQAQAAAGSMTRIRELLDQEPDIADKPGAPALREPARDIVLDGVTLAYGPGRPALDSVSLRIPVGSHVAFVGPSGAGKTSLLNLLLRFWDPTSGRVLIDGHDLRDVTVASLREHFGVILQDTFLFNTTVRANIAFGRPEATDEEIAAAARAAQLHEFIAVLPAGYETVLGDRGVRMSGGQRQRLAIARALLRDPSVLILDEATSALDARTEADLRRSLAAAGEGRTVVSISHRLTSVVAADIVFVLSAGRLVEQGTHDELLAAGGLYHQLWTEQNGPARPEAPAGPDPALALAAVPLLMDAPPEALAALGRRVSRELYGLGTEVTDAGLHRLVVVVDGELELVGDGRQPPVPPVRLGPGDFLGEMSLLREDAPAPTLRAVTPVRLLTLARRDFLAVAGEHPELQRAVLHQLSRRSAALASAVSVSSANDGFGP
jgi:subfamily B ATP-binding cassette protein MsbA